MKDCIRLHNLPISATNISTSEFTLSGRQLQVIRFLSPRNNNNYYWINNIFKNQFMIPHKIILDILKEIYIHALGYKKNKPLNAQNFNYFSSTMVEWNASNNYCKMLDLEIVLSCILLDQNSSQLFTKQKILE
jgi:hypothetical protein